MFVTAASVTYTHANSVAVFPYFRLNKQCYTNVRNYVTIVNIVGIYAINSNCVQTVSV
jgi:hypothetical protein